MPKLTNEAIVAAIIDAGSVTNAAKKLGVSRRTISGRIRSPDCQKLLSDSLRDSVTETASILGTRMTAASAIAFNVMADEKVSPQVRLNAANSILSHGVRFIEMAEFERRLSALEAAQEEGAQQ